MDLDAILRCVLVPGAPDAYAGTLEWWTAHTKRAAELEPVDAAIARPRIASRGRLPALGHIRRSPAPELPRCREGRNG